MAQQTRILSKDDILQEIRDGIWGQLDNFEIESIYSAVYPNDECQYNGDGTFTVTINTL